MARGFEWILRYYTIRVINDGFTSPELCPWICHRFKPSCVLIFRAAAQQEGLLDKVIKIVCDGHIRASNNGQERQQIRMRLDGCVQIWFGTCVKMSSDN